MGGAGGAAEDTAALCADWQRDTGLICDCEIEAETAVSHLTADQQDHLERIIGEALTNTARHAQATAVMLHLYQKGDQLHLTIGDNGRGFDLDAIPSQGHYGLRGLRERVRLLNGTLIIESEPETGTAVLAFLPPCYRTGVVAANGRLTTDQADVRDLTETFKK